MSQDMATQQLIQFFGKGDTISFDHQVHIVVAMTEQEVAHKAAHHVNLHPELIGQLSGSAQQVEDRARQELVHLVDHHTIRRDRGGKARGLAQQQRHHVRTRDHTHQSRYLGLAGARSHATGTNGSTRCKVCVQNGRWRERRGRLVVGVGLSHTKQVRRGRGGAWDQHRSTASSDRFVVVVLLVIPVAIVCLVRARLGVGHGTILVHHALGSSCLLVRIQNRHQALVSSQDQFDHLLHRAVHRQAVNVGFHKVRDQTVSQLMLSCLLGSHSIHDAHHMANLVHDGHLLEVQPHKEERCVADRLVRT
mmetsp:Transcript_9698/g.29891  ORF Transcript_9698/g.29891 Transcript_9698/m.29891 type:complete len:306 (+) Transcript_9698:1263-2180(+)